MMMNDLLQIQKSLGFSRSDPWPRHVDDNELEDDERGRDSEELFMLPVNYNLYHKGYTTKHWLSVFRAFQAVR